MKTKRLSPTGFPKMLALLALQVRGAPLKDRKAWQRIEGIVEHAHFRQRVMRDMARNG